MGNRALLYDESLTTATAAILGNYERVEKLIRHHPGFMPTTSCKAYRMTVEGTPVFIKYYQTIKEGFRFRHLTRAKPLQEWHNIALFQRLGVNTVPPLAVGEKRRLGRFIAGYIVTRELTDTIELSTLASLSPEKFVRGTFFNQLRHSIAQAVSTLHQHHFFHNDLHWRNILIREKPDLEIFIFDAPNGRRWFYPLREYRLVKDLGHLDGTARGILSRTQRLQFYLDYCGHDRLTQQDKQRLRRVIKRSARHSRQAANMKPSFVE